MESTYGSGRLSSMGSLVVAGLIAAATVFGGCKAFSRIPNPKFLSHNPIFGRCVAVQTDSNNASLPDDQYFNETRSLYNTAINALEARKAAIVGATGAQTPEGGMILSGGRTIIDGIRASNNERRRRSRTRRFDHRNCGKGIEHGVEGVDIYCSVPEIDAEIAFLTRSYRDVVADGRVTQTEAMNFSVDADRAIARSEPYKRGGRATRGIF